MRGILAAGAYLPYRRLDRSAIAAVAGKGGGTGTRTVASYDEDATTLAVAAGREALRAAPGMAPSALWFATTTPPYLDKTNATAVHAALRLDAAAPAFDAVGSVRSTVGALRAALAAEGPVLVTAGDLRGGLPGSDDEAAGGDAGAAVLVGDGGRGGAPLLAEALGWGSATAEFVDRWRVPGDAHSKRWEERFGEVQYAELAERAWTDALKATGLDAGAVDRVVVAGPHDRAVAAFARQHGDKAAGTLAATVGNTGAAHPLLLVAAELERARPGTTVALVVLADGADVLVLRTTDAAPAPATVGPGLEAGAPLPYGRYLAWRGLLTVEPPRRPEPARPSSPAAARGGDWKFGFVDEDGRPLADVTGTVRTFTVDRLAHSPSPPVVFAVVDWDGGGRLPVELTDVDAEEVHVGMRVEPTFRKLFTTDGIHNYFWKARPCR
jgi:3-hydroxy-3-methylglutaryl CoA synthase